MRKIYLYLLFCFLSSYSISQSIEEASTKFWTAVNDKNFDDQILYGPIIVDYFKKNNYAVDSIYLDFLLELGNAYGERKDYINSINILEESLKLCEIFYGKKNYNTTFHKYALVISYKNLNNSEKVISLAKECLKEFDFFKGSENNYSICMLQYLSSTFELSNELDSAALYAIEQVKRTKILNGENNQLYLFSIFNLAKIYKNQKKYNDSKILFTKCIELSKNIFDEKHYTYETSLFYLGEINMVLGFFNESIKNNELCLNIRKNIFGENHFLYANTLNNIANCYQYLGDYDKSIALNEECYKIRKNLFKENNEQTWTSLNNLALNYSSKGEFKKSFIINQELVNKKKEILSENTLSYIHSLSNLAVDYGNLSIKDSSFILHLKAFNLLEKNNLNKENLFSIITQNLAFYYLKKSSLDSSELFINKSLENFKSLYSENSLSYIQSLKIQTNILQRKGKNEEAIKNLKVIHDFTIANYGCGSFLYAQSLSDISNFYNSIGYYQSAIDSITKALPIYIKYHGDKHILTLQAMTSLALNLNKLGKIKESLKINLDILEKRSQTVGFYHDDYITSLINTSEDLNLLSDFEKSRNYLLTAISLQEENKTSNYTPSLYTTTLSNYGSILISLNYKDSALFYLNKALVYTRKSIGKNSESYIIKLNNLGNYYLHYDDFAFAKIYLDSAVTISENILGSNHPTSIKCLQNLGSAYGQMNDYWKAIDVEMSCLKRISERRGIKNLEYAHGLHQLAYYDSKIGLDSLALKWNKKAYEIRKEILGSKHPKTQLSAFNLSVDYHRLGNIKEALKLLEENLKINIELNGANSNETISTLNNLGLVYYDLKQYNKSLEYLTQAMHNIKYNKENVALFVNFSLLHEKLGNIKKAIEFQEKAVSYYLDDYLKNQVYLSENQKLNYKQKLDYYTDYLVLLHLKSEFNYLNYSWYNYYISSKNLINKKSNLPILKNSNIDRDEVLTISEQIKLLKNQENKLIEQNNQSKLNEIRNEIEKLEIKYSSILSSSSNNIINFKMIQNFLGNNNEYFIDIISISNHKNNYKRYVANVISKNEINAMLLDTNTFIDNEIFFQYKSQTSEFTSKTDLKSAIFYKKLWKPIADKIGNAKTIYVSLGGVYNNINLNTIYNPTTGKYLIEEKDIRIVNSARDFILSKESEKKKYSTNTASLFGFPNFDGNTTISVDTFDIFASTRNLNSFWLDNLTRGGMKAKPLLATKTEVENISATLKSKGWQVNSFLADNASETNIKKQQSPRILHVATHGYFFQDIPMEKDNNRFLGMDRQQLVQDPMLRSGLLLTGANKTLKGETTTGENGLLSAAEASLLDLRETELVVLSACETGKGEVKNSEGVYGLRKAFSDAGAQNIIMSLWKVDDEVTQEFMSRFYEIWLNDKTSIREAFNKAQLEIKANYPEPYYWGAFILVGE